MDINLAQWAGLGGIPLIQALVALVKTTIPGLPARYYPGVSIVFGVALNEVLAYLIQADYRTAAVVGVVAGLAASGLFTFGKAQELKSKSGLV